MCNAWNHSPDCTCGWGGEGHAGRSSHNGFDNPLARYTRAIEHEPRWWVPPLTSTYSSYTNPNACCPVCGAPVFFYQSPSGGRVFFDELGPPWPKHPCTDNSSRPAPIARLGTSQPGQSSASQPIYVWQRTGWQPFVISSVVGIDKDFLKVTGAVGDKNICLYIQRLAEHHVHVDPLSERSLAQLKPGTTNSYELSFLLPNGKPITILAFQLLSDAHEAHAQELSAKKLQIQTMKSIRRQTAHKSSTEIYKTAPTNGTLPTMETSLAQAFRLAQERPKKT